MIRSLLSIAVALSLPACAGTPGSAAPRSSPYACVRNRGPIDPAPGDTIRGGGSGALRLLNRAIPRYPQALKDRGVEGTVRVTFVLDTLGLVEPLSERIEGSPDDALSLASCDALAHSQFTPIVLGGRAARVLVMDYPFTFALAR